MDAGLLLLLPLLLAFWGWVTFTGRDAWPLSAFPMFSRPYNAADVVVYAVACETNDGRVHWWRPRHHRHAEHVSRRLGGIVTPDGGTAVEQAARGLALRFELGRVLQLEAMDRDGDLPPWRALHLIRRTVFEGGGALSIHDDTIRVVPIDELIRDAPAGHA